MSTIDIYKQQLQELQKEMDEFAYIVSHDLKAPVRAISNLSTWIEEDLGEEISEDVKHNMELLRNRATRMEGMIEALLLYSRVSRLYLETDTVNLDNVIDNLDAKYKGKLTINRATPLPAFETYTQKLVQVFDLLLDNVSRFSGLDNPEVTIACLEASEEQYEFVVTDNGQGIPEEGLQKIFSLFYTIAPKDAVNTIGAGLAIARKIVNFAGGTICAESSTKENGLRIRFTWPKSITKN